MPAEFPVGPGAEDHRAADLVQPGPGGLVAAEAQLALELHRRDAALARAHQVDGRPGREPLDAHVEADETYVGGPEPGKPGRGGGKTVVAGAVESGRGRRLGRLRLAALPDASRQSLESFLAAHVARPTGIVTDGWAGYSGLAAAGWRHEPVNLSASWGDAALRLPAIHLVFSLAKRWLLGTHHGAIRPKHLPAYLDEFVFRFNRRTARCISLRFARVVEHAVQTGPITYRALVATPRPA